MTKINIVVLLLDAVSFKYSWLNSESHWPNLYKLKDKFLNFNNHYSVSNNTRNNLGSITKGLEPSLHKYLNRETSYRSSNFQSLQKYLSKIDYYSLYYATQSLHHSENILDNLDFTEVNYLTPSMADYYIPGKKFNKLIIDRLNNLKNKNFFYFFHYTDVHAPWEVPENRFKNTKKIKKFIAKNIIGVSKRWYWLRFNKKNKIKNKDTFDKYKFLRGNTLPLGPVVSPERFPLREKYYKEVWDTGTLYNDHLELHKNCCIYEDESVFEILNYFKKNSENTIFFMMSDHGNNDLINPKNRFIEGNLTKNLIHVPLSIFSFDEQLINKFRLEGNCDVITSNTDLFNTILNITGYEFPKNEFYQNLLSVDQNLKRYIFAEFNSRRQPFGEVKMFDLNNEFYFRIKSSNTVSELLSENEIINPYNKNEYEIYKDYKTKLNNFNIEREKKFIHEKFFI